MEALLRAARLAKTAAVIAADYQVYYMQRKQRPDSLASKVYTWASQSNDHISDEELDRKQKQLQLEDQIEHLERDLDRAQHDYVVGSNSSENNKQPNTASSANDADDSVYNDTSTLSEQTLAKRDKKEAMMEVAGQLANAQEELASLVTDNAEVHQRNAHRLLQLCRTNGGVYIKGEIVSLHRLLNCYCVAYLTIAFCSSHFCYHPHQTFHKVGQHLANLDLMLPAEYIQTLSSLFDDAPVSSYKNVCDVVKEELGSLPEQLFSEFSEAPFASASLAQVHTATCKETGKKLAIKVQHKGLRETSEGDLFAMSTVVSVAETLFDDFNFGWICEEMTPQVRAIAWTFKTSS